MIYMFLYCNCWTKVFLPVHPYQVRCKRWGQNLVLYHTKPNGPMVYVEMFSLTQGVIITEYLHITGLKQDGFQISTIKWLHSEPYFFLYISSLLKFLTVIFLNLLQGNCRSFLSSVFYFAEILPNFIVIFSLYLHGKKNKIKVEENKDGDLWFLLALLNTSPVVSEPEEKKNIWAFV